MCYSVGAYGGAEDAAALAIDFVTGSAEIELKYFRLAHTRALKESYRFNVWQAQTFLGPTPPLDDNGHLDDNGIGRMIAVGKDHATSDAVHGISSVQYLDTPTTTWSCKFDTINLAQVPSFLLISAPRINSVFC